VHQIAYARALENPTGADLMKLFQTPRIPTDRIPECKVHTRRGEHLKLYRFSPNDYLELGAVFNGPNPETGEELVVVDEAPAGAAANDLPAPPDYAPEEIAEIAQRLRKQAGLPNCRTRGGWFWSPGVGGRALSVVVDGCIARASRQGLWCVRCWSGRWRRRPSR
jgi:hypothetical protein